MQPEQSTDDYLKPVAYDAQGQPLYAHPVEATQPAAPQQPAVVHFSRAVEPNQVAISPELKAKHDESTVLFPNLNLSEQEYIIRAIHRHPIGLFAPLTVGVLLVAFLLSVLFNYDIIVTSLSLTGVLADVPLVAVGILLFTGLIAFGTYVAYFVYENNRFYLTNESVIQEIQTSLFSKKEQTVSLANIEDASYDQNGIIQQMFDYGSIRLSTEGDETTYRFTYVAHPKNHIAILNNAVESFKNGRPVSDD